MALHKGGHPESNSEYGKSLSRIAKEVDRLVMDDWGMNHFRDCIRPFGKRWNDHISDRERERKRLKEHWEKVKANPKWQDKNAGSPRKGWEWDRDYLAPGRSELQNPLGVKKENAYKGPMYEMPVELVPQYIDKSKGLIKRLEKNKKQANSPDKKAKIQAEIDERKAKIDKVKTSFEASQKSKNTWIEAGYLWWRVIGKSENEFWGCWRPPIEIREDPVCRLMPKDVTKSKDLSVPKSKTEEYERYYIYLSAIHDNILTGCEPINNEIWPEQLAWEIWNLFKWDGRYGPDIPFIEAALDHVKVDLAVREEAERESRQGKMGFHGRRPK